MAFDRMPGTYLRAERNEAARLGWAFALSLALHLLVFGTFQAGKQLGWWQRFHWPAWTKPPKMLTEILKKQQEEKKVKPPEEIPLVFVEVSPAQATPEPPKQVKFYSNKNSQAANKEADKDTATPKFEGKHPELAKTEDVPREQFVPLQPSPPPPVKPEPKVKEPEPKPNEPESKPKEPELKPKEEKPKPQEVEPKPTPAQPPGDLALAKPEPTPKQDEAQEKRPKPRTVQEAKARLQENQSPGQKMKQDGGVRSNIRLDSLDAKASPFGDYDLLLINAIRGAWYDLLDAQSYAADYRGKVVLRFHLHYDGRVTDLSVVESTAGPIPSSICESAIEKPKPFARFPAEMRSAVGDIRSIQFTFFYD